MSNELAIAAVTKTLYNLLEGIQELKNNLELYNKLPVDFRPTGDIEVKTLSLDAALEEDDKLKNYVNLFLYHVEYNAAWRNMDIPGQVKQGETGHTPLALNLHYIITAYGENENEYIAHLLLGKAMSILHDHSILGRAEIEDALEVSELHKQVERVRITPQPISLDEISKLWTGFQAKFRLSVAYQVSVVLIESKHVVRTPLPVLTRGNFDDKGVLVQPGLIPPYPTLEAVSFPKNRTGALLGDDLALTGHHLTGDFVTMHFSHPLLEQPNEVPVTPGKHWSTKITVTVPNNPAKWPAGFYKIAALINKTGQQDRITNDIPFMLMPSINNVVINPANYLTTVTCSPKVLPDQDASLLLGDREFKADSHPNKTDTLTFKLNDVSAGEKYFVRLRIDGVDSPLIDRSVTPPVFDSNYEVTIP
jgi:hypothetical protein